MYEVPLHLQLNLKIALRTHLHIDTDKADITKR